MPIYQVSKERLLPYTRVLPGADLYEKQIEDLAWSDLEAFTGEALFPVARQPRIQGGGIPDIVALTATGSVVVVEVKRDIDRNQLAQLLEYAGWARLTSLDEIAQMYSISPDHKGSNAFFTDWMEFTETNTPMTISAAPRLILIARDFHGRTRSALQFLEENGLPVTVIPVSLYKDPEGTEVVYIDVDHDPVQQVDQTGKSDSSRRPAITLNGERVTVSDLLANEVLLAGEQVVFLRPRLGRRHEATINADGTFTIEDGSIWNSPSLAAIHAADVVSYDGWEAWRVPRLDNARLHDLRVKFVSDSLQKDA